MRILRRAGAALAGVLVASSLTMLPTNAAGEKIVGTVADADTGAAITTERIDVEVHNPDGSNPFTQTDRADGTYELDVSTLDVGDYKMSVGGTKFYIRKSDLDVTVSAGATTTVDVELTEGGYVTGAFVDETGDPVGEFAHVFDAVTGKALSGPRSLFTGGDFELRGVPAGPIKLRSANFSSFPRQFLDSSTFRTSTTVNVARGAETNIGNFTLYNGSPVTGTVTDPAGDPVEDVDVKICTAPDCQGRSRATTDSSGEFTIADVVDGDHVFRVEPPSGTDFATMYNDGASSYSEASLISTGSDTPVDFRLIPGGIIDVLDDPVNEERLFRAYNADEQLIGGDYVRECAVGGVIENLPTGTFKLAIHTKLGGGAWELTEWIGGGSFATATPTEVTSGVTTSVDVRSGDGDPSCEDGGGDEGGDVSGGDEGGDVSGGDESGVGGTENGGGDLPDTGVSSGFGVALVALFFIGGATMLVIARQRRGIV